MKPSTIGTLLILLFFGAGFWAVTHWSQFIGIVEVLNETLR